MTDEQASTTQTTAAQTTTAQTNTAPAKTGQAAGPGGPALIGWDGADGAPFLGVGKSLSGKAWHMRGGNDRLGMAISQRLGAPEIMGRVMAARGVALDDAEGFVNPTLRRYLPDPGHLKDMEPAVHRLVRAIKRGEKVAVFGDYDVDGATSAALLKRFFKAIGRDLRVYVPDRLREGYGPNAEALRRLRQEGADLVVTVDCGIVAFEALDAAVAAGLDVVVVDHHVAEPRLPRAVAVVNPNRLDDDSTYGNLAAVGVTYLLVIALNRALREAGWYRTHKEPDLLQWLDLVALGTVCDVVPLTGLNRALVSQGLKVMGRRSNAGIAALFDVGRVDEPPSAYHLGFVLGPRVNAGGRVGQSDLGCRLLSHDDGPVAAELAHRLDAYNSERQAIEAGVLGAAIEQVERSAEGPGPLVMAVGEGWHPGVIGIVASRLKERYDRPAIVISVDGSVGKGSGRSVRGVDLGAVVVAAKQAGLLVNGGGHPMAAGLTAERSALPDLAQFMAERIGRQIEDKGVAPAMGFDGALNIWAVSAVLIRSLSKMEPYGAGNPEPRFAIPAARVMRAEVVGEHHVRCVLSGADGGRLKAIAFRSVDTPLGRALLTGALPLHVGGRLRLDTWAGRNAVQMVVDDAAEVPG